MPSSYNTIYIRNIDFEYNSQTEGNSLNGTATYELDENGPSTVFVPYFYFVDGNGDQIDASSGTVTLTVSQGADIFQTIDNNTFNAADARSATRTVPSGIGRADKIRVVTSGVSTNAVAYVFGVRQTNE